MAKFASIFCFVLVAAVGGCKTSAGAKAPAAETAASSTPAAAAANIVMPGEAAVGDTSMCLVSGETFVVSADSPKTEHEGKTYYFCCAGCDAKFAADPAKFLASMPTPGAAGAHQD